MAVEVFYNAKTVWMSDIDKSASLAITENWNLPNLGDLKAVNWLDTEPIDILTAGYPCQPFSTAGQRKGAKDERHLWPHIKKVISQLRPRIVILENVRGHLSLGFKEVLKDLTEIRYDAKWTTVRASDVGAPHRRERLFVIAYANSKTHEQPRRNNREFYGEGEEILYRADREIHRRSSAVSYGRDGEGQDAETFKYTNSDGERQLLGSDDSRPSRNQGKPQFESAFVGAFNCNSNSEQLSPDRTLQKLGRRFNSRFEMSVRAIPHPLVDGKLNEQFVEYMMGLPKGWVTDLNISRAQKFKLLGNGVVPQQAYHALQILEGQ